MNNKTDNKVEQDIQKGLEHFFTGDGKEVIKNLLSTYLAEMQAVEKKEGHNSQMVNEIKQQSQKMIDEMIASIGLSREDLFAFIGDSKNFSPDLWEMLQVFMNQKDTSEKEGHKKGPWLKT